MDDAPGYLEEAEDPVQERHIELLDLKRVIEGRMKILSPRLERVVRMRYGFNLEEELTLEEVGEQMNVTRERVRQMSLKAFSRMRGNSGKKLNLAVELDRGYIPEWLKN